MGLFVFFPLFLLAIRFLFFFFGFIPVVTRILFVYQHALSFTVFFLKLIFQVAFFFISATMFKLIQGGERGQSYRLQFYERLRDWECRIHIHYTTWMHGRRTRNRGVFTLYFFFIFYFFFWDKNTRGYLFIFISFLLFIPYLLFISAGEEKKLYLFDVRFCVGGRGRGGEGSNLLLYGRGCRIRTFFV